MRKWIYESYLQAKMAMLRMWEQHWGKMICAVCGERIKGSPVCHHVWLSQRFKKAKSDLRNLAPVHSRCHDRAHSDLAAEVERRLLLVLGDGDLEKGRKIVDEAGNEWTPRTWRNI